MLAAVLCGLGFVAVFAVAAYFVITSNLPSGPTIPLQQRMFAQVFLIMGLYAVNFLVVAMSVMLPVDSLSGEISSGIMQTIASKPIRRWQIVLGKWLVYWAMMAGYILLMAGGVVLAVGLMTGFWQQRLPPALALMLLESTVLLTITIAGGTRFTSVTNGIVAFGFYALAFIGGWMEQIGVLSGNVTARYIGTAISLVSPADAIWRMAAHILQPPILNQVQVTPFTSAAAPAAAMVWWAVGFVVAGLLVGMRASRSGLCSRSCILFILGAGG